MRELWFTEKDLRNRWSEVKENFWEEFEGRMKLAAKRLLECCLRVEREISIRAGRYQRSKERLDQANGYYLRDVICKLGVLSKVFIPRSRQGVYKSQILERYKRFGGNFDRYILKMFTLGLATERVKRFFRDFFRVASFSSQTVSNILQRVSQELEGYHKRKLDDKFCYLYLDGLNVTIRGAFKRKQVVLFALGEYEDGRRELIDFRVATSEKGIYWLGFLEDLYRRGLEGSHLKLVVIDEARGLVEAVRTVYGFVPLQVCWIHRQRNMVKRLSRRGHRKEICADVKEIFNAGSREEAIELLKRFKSKWQPREPRAVKNFLRDIDLSLTFFSQPKPRWKQLASNNIIERGLREIRRRIRLVDSFRDERSCERIIFTQVLEYNRKQELNP